MNHHPASRTDLSVDPSPAVELRSVFFQRGEHPIINGLSLKVAQGELLVLLGRSGCGKTTTLKLINRLVEPTHGTILLADRPITAWAPIQLRRRIGYVIQDVGLFPHFTVARNVGLVPQLEGWPATRIATRVEEMLHLVGLDPRVFAARYPDQLSGGQRQRVGVARALAADPPLLLMDEPFGALDPITRAAMQREFRALQQRLGKTVILVTHDVREAFVLADRIGLMHAGTLRQLLPPAAFRQTEDPEAQAFLACLDLGSTGATEKPR